MSDEQYQQLLSDSRSYLNTQFDLLRLRLLEKLSRIIGLILFALVSIQYFYHLQLLYLLLLLPLLLLFLEYCLHLHFEYFVVFLLHQYFL